MTETLPLIIDSIHGQGIEKVGAVVNRKNTAAIKVLKKAKFMYNDQFDIVQDLYLATALKQN